MYTDALLEALRSAEEDDDIGTVAHILKRRPQKLITLDKVTTVRKAIGTLKEHGFSQIPVVDENKRHCGIVSEIDLLNHLVEHTDGLEHPIGELLSADYATVTPHTRTTLLKNIFNDAKAVLVVEPGSRAKCDKSHGISQQSVASAPGARAF